MKLLYLKDNFLIRAAYKTINEYDGTDELYFILSDGTVIYVDGRSIKDNPAYKVMPNLKSDILRYGGKCSCGNLIVGKQVNNDKKNWNFYCIKCQNNILYSDNKVDEIVYNALLELEKELN
jgi:hypothetical protein